VSEPKRYLAKCPWYAIEMQAHPRGEFVLYSDYARLKAECQARQAENSVLAVECDSLKTEVERLTKAGDAMRDILCWCYMDGYPSKKEAEDKWNAAKKGGQP